MTGSPQKKQKYSPGPTCCGACWSAFCKTCVACSSLHSWQLASRTLHSFLRCVSVPKSKICCLFAAGWGVCINTTWDEFGIYQMEPILKFEVTWGRKIQMGLHNLSHDVYIYIYNILKHLFSAESQGTCSCPIPRKQAIYPSISYWQLLLQVETESGMSLIHGAILCWWDSEFFNMNVLSFIFFVGTIGRRLKLVHGFYVWKLATL